MYVRTLYIYLYFTTYHVFLVLKLYVIKYCIYYRQRRVPGDREIDSPLYPEQRGGGARVVLPLPEAAGGQLPLPLPCLL